MSLSTWLESPQVLRLGWTILHSVWQILAVSLTLALILPRLRRCGPRHAYAASCVALGICLLLPIATFFVPANVQPTTPTRASAPHTNAQAAIITRHDSESPASEHDLSHVRNAGAVSPITTPRQPLVIRMKMTLAPWLPWLAVTWVAGVVLLSVWNCAAWLAVLRLKTAGTFAVSQQIEDTARRLAEQMGLSRVVRLVQSLTVDSPIVAGAWRPVILLPAALVLEIPPDQLEALLAHELAHILRQDYLVNLLQTAVETLLFYHPGVWWISARIRSEREDCCDDLALRVTTNRAVYVRALSAVAGARTPVLAPAASGGLLIARLHRILGIARPEAGHPARWLASIMLLTLCGFVAGYVVIPANATIAAAPAAEPEAAKKTTPSKPPETPRPAAKPVNVLCVDREGKPVPGAEIFVFQHNDGKDDAGRYLQFGPFKSDSQGQATGPAEQLMTKEGNYDRWFYARVPGKLVGVARSTKWTGSKPYNAENKVRLFPSMSVSGDVTVPEGFDRTKVLVKIRTFWVTTSQDASPAFFNYESFPREDSFPGLGTALPEIFDRHPDAAGHIQFDDVPVKGRLGLMTVGEGLAEAQWSNYEKSFDKPIELKIVKESRLTGRVLLPDGQPAAGMKVFARVADTVRIPYLSSFPATTNDNGEFVIRGLPSLDISFRIRDPRQAWVFRPMELLRVPAEESLVLEPIMEKGVLVSGRAIDSAGNPVAGAGISAISDSRVGVGLGDDGTDKDGRFRFRLPSGKARIYFNALPDGLAYPEPQIVKELDLQPGQPDMELNFTIQRKAK